MGNDQAPKGSSTSGKSAGKQQKPPAFAISQDPVVADHPEADPHKYEAYARRAAGVAR
jgi:hypothetical protein